MQMGAPARECSRPSVSSGTQPVSPQRASIRHLDAGDVTEGEFASNDRTINEVEVMNEIHEGHHQSRFEFPLIYHFSTILQQR